MNYFEKYPDTASKRLLLLSLAFAMMVDFIPFSGSLFYWLPELTAMLLLYWVINAPHRVGIGAAFIVGLLVDIGTGSPTGMHSLAYMAAAYLLIRNLRQIVLYDYGQQAVVVAIALMSSEVVQVLVRLRYDHRFSGWLVFLSPFLGALLWPSLNKVMVSLTNLRRLKR